MIVHLVPVRRCRREIQPTTQSPQHGVHREHPHTRPLVLLRLYWFSGNETPLQVRRNTGTRIRDFNQ